MQAAIHSLRSWYYQQIQGPVDHRAVVEALAPDAGVSRRFLFMVLMSCGIAILGLLQSSPAVVIGAMLISPLMGPIMNFGFSLTLLDMAWMRRSLTALTVGAVMAVVMAMLVVRASPLRDVTSEILARTRPNLFDLMVAVFSGMAGTYATIKRKGEAIVGVAIATALMPPLAVVGYGIAVGSSDIAGGAFFLFMTNLLAISLTAALMARWYGFGAMHAPHHTLLQTLLIVATFVALSLPLGVALRQIAREALAAQTARAELHAFWHDIRHRIEALQLLPTPTGWRVDAVVLSEEILPEASDALRQRLVAALGEGVELNLDQVRMNEKALALPVITQAKPPVPAPKPEPSAAERNAAQADAIAAASVVPLATVDADADRRVATGWTLAGVELAAVMAAERELAARFPRWQLALVPAPTALPELVFEVGGSELTPAIEAELTVIAFALQRWQIGALTVMGHASTSGDHRRFNNPALAQRRAEAVGAWLRDKGFDVQQVAMGRAPQQPELEREWGERAFRIVRVIPRAKADTAAGAEVHASDEAAAP